MSPMAVTGSIFNHDEISAGGTASKKELEREKRKGERKKGYGKGEGEGQKKAAGKREKLANSQHQ